MWVVLQVNQDIESDDWFDDVVAVYGPFMTHNDALDFVQGTESDEPHQDFLVRKMTSPRSLALTHDVESATGLRLWRRDRD